jgi:L-proline amide hydrolase
MVTTTTGADCALQSRTGELKFTKWRTWYRVTSAEPALASDSVDRAPVVVLHGGPGSAHDYLLAYAELAASGHAVVHYDQLGCGRSTHLPYQDPSFWTIELFLEQLDTVLAGLQLGDRYHLLGHSWGGMLAVEHALRRPRGLVSLVVADAPASMELWIAESKRLRAKLPSSVLKILESHEAAGTLQDPAYEAALRPYYDRHVCRLTPPPEEMRRSEVECQSDPTTYLAMWGPNECYVTGSLRDWTAVERLHVISVPTLVISGVDDQATKVTIQPFVDRVPDVRWHQFKKASHNPHLEARQACLSTVAQFFRQNEPGKNPVIPA